MALLAIYLCVNARSDLLNCGLPHLPPNVRVHGTVRMDYNHYGISGFAEWHVWVR